MSERVYLNVFFKPVFIADNGVFSGVGGGCSVLHPHTSAQTKALIETAISHLVLLLSCLLGIHASLSDDKVVPVRGGTRRVSQPSRFKEWEDWAGVSTVRRSVTGLWHPRGARTTASNRQRPSDHPLVGSTTRATRPGPST